MTDRTITVEINGKKVTASVAPRLLLVDFIRENAGLTGTHVGCTFEGVCGACTVQLDGEAIKSCMMLAVQADKRAITTIEGLGDSRVPHLLQTSFRDHGGLQCGYCTPGIIMNMEDFLRRNPAPTDEEIRHALVGNLCRCTGYSHIVDAVRAAAQQLGTVEKEAAE